jgi:transglutaminase-like putative cysteine protease/predicted glutamine amidotransferase
MPNLLAMSFEGSLTPAFDLHCLDPGQTPPDGWGIACYPGGEPAALVLKEAGPAHGSIRSALVSAWERLESSIFLVHVRTAIWGAITEANTQPFQRAWGRRDWLIAHSGSLERKLEVPALFEPVGSTDTEQIFCDLLARIAGRGFRSIGEVPPRLLVSWFHELNSHGGLTTALADGEDLVVYADRRGNGDAWVCELLPPYGQTAFGDRDLTVDLTRRGIRSRKGVLVCSDPLEPRKGEGGAWRRLSPGHLLIVRQGAVRAEVGAEGIESPPAGTEVSPPPFVRRARPVHSTSRAEVRRYQVLHQTVYRYQEAVERSAHVLRLFPAHDRLQTVHSCRLEISVPGQHRDFEDVFGNRVRRLMLDTPFTELSIAAHSEVEVLDVEPLDFRPARLRLTLPLVWMPWQRQILQPFLLPPELPESQLTELTEYAMSFARRNDDELLDTLLDLNATIFSEYRYEQGSTSQTTSPFDVYATRRGVCQDFANLFICVARLLGVPARYVCGYVFTGSTPEHARMADASHAWVQVYLPEVGWRGFDPTNGKLTQTDHVRVAVGRNYIDATPTSGTLYVGGNGESLSVQVTMVRAGSS